MLQFLRKHQKVFLAIVATITIASFLFFGSYSAIQGSTQSADRRIGVTIDGKPLMEKELALLMRFVNSSSYDASFIQKGITPNLLSDGIVEKDFIESHLASIILEKNYDLFKEDFEKTLDQIKQYRPYTHPRNSAISTLHVWQKTAPTIEKIYEKLSTEQNVSCETGDLLLSLYHAQNAFPQNVLRSFLEYEETKMPHLLKDPLLAKMDLSICGFSTLEDWMGKRFVHFLAQTILNGAVLAKEKKIAVSQEEVALFLRNNLRNNLASFTKEPPSPSELEKIYRHQIALLQASEREVFDACQKIILFRKWLALEERSILTDNSLFSHLGVFAKEQVSLDLYYLPSHLCLKNFHDLLKLEVYLKAVSKEKRTKSPSLTLPSSYAKPEEIELSFPELVAVDAEVEIEESTFYELKKDIPLKEIHLFELAEENWKEKIAQIPALQGKKGNSRQERYQLLEELPQEIRIQLDHTAKKAILKKRSASSCNMFQKASKKIEKFSLRSQGGKLPIKGTINPRSLKKELMSVPVGTPIFYSPDDENHYKITLLKPLSPLRILSFAETQSDGTLDLLVDKELSSAYPEVRKKHPALFALKEGGWKPFSEVKNLIGAELYPDLLHKIEETVQLLDLPRQVNWQHSLDEYAKYRLALHILQNKEALITQEKIPSSQWDLVKKNALFNRVEASQKSLKEIFHNPSFSISTIRLDPMKGLYFYQIHGPIKNSSEKKVIGSLSELVALDTKQLALSRLLEKMIETGAVIILPLYPP